MGQTRGLRGSRKTDGRQRQKSSFNRKREIHDAMRTIVSNLDVNHLVVSFSNEGYIERDEMVEI